MSHLTYPSRVLPLAHPDHVLSTAELMGHTPRRSDALRVLDLGCGTGTHALAAAETLPHATFDLIDRSAECVKTARQRAAGVGLDRRVTVHHGDLLEADLEPADVVVCWGVFSWIPQADHARLLTRIRACLRPGGVALVSWNVLPGWHMYGLIRDVLRFHTRNLTDPEQMVHEARRVLGFLGTYTGHDRDDYTGLLRHVRQQFQTLPDGYLFHEYLCEHNHPVALNTFAHLADQNGLRFLGEAAPGHASPEQFPEEVRAMLEAEREQRSDPLYVEQLIDFLRNTRFRASILVREEDRRTVSPTPAQYHWRAAFDDLTAMGGDLQADGMDGVSTATNRALANLLKQVHEARPRWVCGTRLGANTPAGADAILRAWRLGWIHPRKHPPALAASPSASTTCSPLARLLAHTGEDLPSLTGEPIATDHMGRALVRLADGRSRAELLAAWSDALGQALPHTAVDDALLQLWRQGLLR